MFKRLAKYFNYIYLLSVGQHRRILKSLKQSKDYK